MILDELKLKNKLIGNYFFFAADEKYLNLYGKALALSLKKHAPWANVHIHIYNPLKDQIAWCNNNHISYSEEIISEAHPQFRTLCACTRFIRIPEIFSDCARILSFDCDVIANNTIPQKLFIENTNQSRVTIKKGGKSLASSISFGLDNFRHEYRKRLLDNYKKDNIFWFLDQKILDEMLIQGLIGSLSSEWSNTKMTPDRMIWTAKGSRKDNKQQYKDLLDYYNSLS